jgi:hypothetical protein
MSVTPIFLISLPRSGSTLLQRMLATGGEIAGTNEPWFMLPLWSMRQRSTARAGYSHQTAVDALNDLLDNLPDGDASYRLAVRDFALRIYEELARGRPYFLDKTPRYYLMVDFLHQVFPEARFIFLVRNPLSVLASIIQTWYQGHFMWFDHWIDWKQGHACMAAAIRSRREGDLVVHYEDLVRTPQATLESLCAGLGIDFHREMITDYKSIDWKGKLGDPTGIHRYAGVSDASLSKWTELFSSRYRRRVAANMLGSLDREDLRVLGYDTKTLLDALNSTAPKPGLDFSGRCDGMLNWLLHRLDYRYLKDRIHDSRNNGFHYLRT